MSKLFQASDFQPTRWNTAEDKVRFANWLAGFTRAPALRSGARAGVSNGCLADKLPQWAPTLWAAAQDTKLLQCAKIAFGPTIVWQLLADGIFADAWARLIQHLVKTKQLTAEVAP